MAKPTFWVKLAAAANPYDAAPVWTDITSYCREMSWSRGRGSSLDEIGAGGGTLKLNNKTRRFDPSYAAGPYYPLRPYRPVNIGCTWNSVDYSLGYYFADNWHVTWDSNWGTAYAETEVTLVDAIALLANQSYRTNFAAQNSVASRISSILNQNYILFPVAMRDITAALGLTCKTITIVPAPVQEVTKNGGGANGGTTTYPNAWEMIQAHVRSHSADIPCFIDRRGYAVYKASVASGLTFGDSGTELRYVAAGLNDGIDLVYNRVEVTAEGGVMQAVIDNTSQTSYRERPLSRGTYNVSDAAALTVANALLAAYKDPKARIEGFQVRPGTTSALWDAVITLDLEHTITVRRRPPGGGTLFEQVPKIVGLNWNVQGPSQQTVINYTLTGTTL